MALAVEPVEERTRRQSMMPPASRSLLPTKSINTSWAPPPEARGTMASRIPGPAAVPHFVIGVRSSPPSIPIASSPWAGWILLASALFLCATVLGAFLYYG
ncbi:hypothetical protein AKJ09_05495 [Labilithrix luteola]|uniref:Uncharacterized protein n=1 Tax=Labilithrix luteola TaxID=1391654 RepID=A0A0K1PZM4_9BACT|nr:hypothetical protein AKJ09_05495 [Labilithrix luteola]